MHSLQLKIFALVVGLLLLVECLSLGVLYQHMRADTIKGLNAQLQQGQQIFRSQFRARSQVLDVYAQTLAKDFGLLAALHAGPKSLRDALLVRQQRVGADLAVVVDTRGKILAETGNPALPPPTFQLSANDRSGSLFFDNAGMLYQMAGAPVNAPARAGWIYLGFRIDATLAQQLASSTALEITFLRRDTARHWQVVASSLPAEPRADLERQLNAAGEPSASGMLRLAGDKYLGLASLLSPASATPVSVLLQTSQSAAMVRNRSWWRQIIGVLAGALLLALIGAWLLARNIVRPVRLLVSHASAVATGNSTEPITLSQRGELGELMHEFNRMQAAVSQREHSLRHLAEHDPVTGLANRLSLEKHIAREIDKPDDVNRRLAVLIVNLDRFKDINDSLGYDAGDRLLRAVGKRLRAIVADDDVVARIGSDEFGLLLCNITVSELHTRLDPIVAALSEPHQAEGLTLHVTAGTGVAIYPDHGRDASALLRHADMAKGTAKSRRLPYSIYDGSQDRHSLLRLSLLAELQNAINRNELQLHYQPKLSLDNRAVVAAEALVRWQHPAYGLIPPAEFIPMLEQTGNIGTVTQWAFRRAIAQAKAWQQAAMNMRVAINISAHDLREGNFARELERVLRAAQCNPQLLALEITESAIMEDVNQSIATFRRLRGLGLTLSIDDYGTGYSSMAQLKRLPVDELKIDKSFVMDMNQNSDDETIVRSIIELGHNMGLQVTAEGVESRASLALLHKLHCDTAQGNYISRALHAEHFHQWWQSGSWKSRIAR
ncbi:MAG TPA: EAL domain-containing protein [Gammaproteobacteria bacterium]|nr:EAL domain-containing protein [Gammaproteobacteria bacterium]